MSPRVRDDSSPHYDEWARLRFAVVGPLLSSPPGRGELREAIKKLAARSWRHPVTGEPVQFAFSTIETWYYIARNAPLDPVTALRRTPRCDLGRRIAIGPELKERIFRQYGNHKSWSYKLHYDNFLALIEEEADKYGRAPSYSTIRRFMKENGLLKKKPARTARSPGELEAMERFESREVRGFEAEYVGALWHLDFHHGRRTVLTSDGRWLRPILLAVLDDFSRLCCHAQWYFAETAEVLVHGFSQALLKRDLPRSVMSDRGSAMTCEEFTSGLTRLGCLHEPTLPYSPYQNGKQETFFDTVEGRLMKMLENVANLTLDFLNRATQAWVEEEYNRTRHEEIDERPLERFLRGPDVSRPAPSSGEIRGAFRRDVRRTQRRSDGTVRLETTRFEVPDRFRHLSRLTLRYARWDLASVHLVDPRSGALLAPLYPVDKARNADGKRRVRAATTPPADLEPESSEEAVPPLLRKLLRRYSANGLPPGYLHHESPETTEDER